MKNHNERNESKDEMDDPTQKNKITNKSAEKPKDNEDEMTERSDDAGYTPEENQFADGKGTQLDGQIDKDSIKK